ncbi:hypothetical protein yc1106_10049 [Curvularia clavata]|uniref:Cutinase n=1 Tax=Curvularia clavata TaxID=95742 RepID=A0A9Q8ZJB9_CURCL|nr:hypothetical protein yc1106_10049 [Curvularia clavata]
MKYHTAHVLAFASVASIASARPHPVAPDAATPSPTPSSSYGSGSGSGSDSGSGSGSGSGTGLGGGLLGGLMPSLGGGSGSGSGGGLFGGLFPGLGGGSGSGSGSGLPGLGGGLGGGLSLPTNLPGLGGGLGGGLTLPTNLPSLGGGLTGGLPGLGGLGSLGGSAKSTTGSGDSGSLPGGLGGLTGGLGGLTGGLGGLTGGLGGGAGGAGGAGSSNDAPSTPTTPVGNNTGGSGSIGSNCKPQAASSGLLGGSENGIVDKNCCTDMTIVFARGTGEMGNVGTVSGPPMFKAIRSKLGDGRVTVQGVDYAASAAGNANLGGDGGEKMAALVKQAKSQCPNTKVIVSGYSQGAMVVHNAFSKGLSAADVSGAVMFGDPLKRAAITGLSADKIKQFCGTADMICGGGGDGGATGSHISYGSSADAAAAFAIQAAGLA